MVDVYAVDNAWRLHSSRGFWTRRKRTATSLLTVLVLLGGTAIAYKAFELEVPNNVVRDASSFQYEIFKKDKEVGDTGFVQAGATTPIFAPVTVVPGDDRRVQVRIDNLNEAPAKDASFDVYTANIGVLDNNDQVPTNTAQRNRFIQFFQLRLDKEKVLQAADADVANEDDHGVTAGEPNGSPGDDNLRMAPDGTPEELRPMVDGIFYTEACAALLTQLTATNPCRLGMVRAHGSKDVLGGETWRRYFLFTLRERDEGVQTEFAGWTLSFDLVFRAKIPADPEPNVVGPLSVVVEER